MGRTLIILAITGIILSLSYIVEALHYPWGNLAQPGPGFYPLLIGILLGVGFLGTGLEAALLKSSRKVDWPRGASLGRVVAIALGGLGYVLFLPFLGHPVAGGLVTLVVLQAMNLPSWPLKIGLSLANGFGSFFLFSVLLGVPLPMGFWQD